MLQSTKHESRQRRIYTPSELISPLIIRTQIVWMILKNMGRAAEIATMRKDLQPNGIRANLRQLGKETVVWTEIRAVVTWRANRKIR